MKAVVMVTYIYKVFFLELFKFVDMSFYNNVNILNLDIPIRFIPHDFGNIKRLAYTVGKILHY